MTSPDSNDDATSSKYNVQIGEGKGIVIGDNAHVVQHFYGTPDRATGGSDSSRSDLPTAGGGRVQVAELQRLRSPRLVPRKRAAGGCLRAPDSDCGESDPRARVDRRRRARPSGMRVGSGNG